MDGVLITKSSKMSCKNTFEFMNQCSIKKDFTPLRQQQLWLPLKDRPNLLEKRFRRPFQHQNYHTMAPGPAEQICTDKYQFELTHFCGKTSFNWLQKVIVVLFFHTDTMSIVIGFFRFLMWDLDFLISLSYIPILRKFDS